MLLSSSLDFSFGWGWRQTAGSDGPLVQLTNVLKRTAQIVSPCGEHSASDISQCIFMLLLGTSSPSKTATDLKMGLL